MPTDPQYGEVLQPPVSVVAPSALGGTLGEYVRYLERLGRPCDLSAGGEYAWVPGVTGELQRFPLECSQPVEPEVLRHLLKRPGIWLASYLLEESPAAVANCFDYVCSDPEYALDRLAKNARRDIRRGLRSFLVRLCTWDELRDKGFPAHSETNVRHGYASPHVSSFHEMIARQRATPFYEVWGAWRGGELAAWMTLLKIDGWAMVDIARSRTAWLRECPNNAVLYRATEHILKNDKYAYITYGLSSIQVDVNELSMHRYKTRMGYIPLRRHRRFFLHPLLRPFLSRNLGSWALERLAAVCPQSANLRKSAGMSRLLSGRQARPLAWADEGAEP